MTYIIVGLGNPGEEYENTRHNVGRIALEAFRKAQDLPEWERDGARNALVSKGTLGGKDVAKSLKGAAKKVGTLLLIEPETFMNKSGASLKSVVVNPKKAPELIVIHDDLDLPLGRIKISYNKSAGGHRGVQSIVKQVKSEAFIRVRVGISKANAKGVVKKPQGEEAVNDFIIGKFKPAELDIIKKEAKVVAEGLVCVLTEGKDKAMTMFNSR